MKQQILDILDDMNGDPLLLTTRQLWSSSIDSTINHLDSLRLNDPERFEIIKSSVFFLSLAVSQWHQMMDNTIAMNKRNLMHNLSGDLLVQRIREVDPPIIFSNLRTNLTPIPFESGTNYVVNCKMNSASNLCDCYGIAHEIGHLLMLKYIEAKSPEYLLEFFALEIWELRNEYSIPMADVGLVLERWSARWIHELVADAFAILNWGPGYVIHFIRETNDEDNKKNGDNEYPPTDMRIKWMIEKLLESRDNYHKGTLDFLEGIATHTNYGLQPEFWTPNNSPGWRSRRNLTKVVYHNRVISKAMEIVSDVLSWGSVEQYPPATIEDVSNLLNGNIQSVSTDNVKSSSRILPSTLL